MKTIILFLLISFSASAQNFNFQRSWGTYFGDERFKLKDSKTDKQGNLYLVGVFINGTSTAQPVFPTSNSIQPTFGGGLSDGFIAKFDNVGQLSWATYFGGTDIDLISGIDFDSSNNLYIAGFTQSSNNIATPNANQTTLNGTSDFFIAKFTPTGILQWSTYYGGDGTEGFGLAEISSGDYSLNRLSISHDKSNNFYIAGYSESQNLGTANTFQPIKDQSGQIIAKFDNDSNHIWTTYYSFNGNYMLAIKASTTALYVRGRINNCNPAHPSDNNYYGSANGYQPTSLNCSNTFLSKFNSSGQRDWSTYYADSNSTSKKSLDIFQDKVYFSGVSSSNLVTTSGVFQQSPGLESPPYLVQFTENGTRDWGTYNGSNFGYPASGGNYGADYTSIDESGGVYLSGVTGLHSNFATTGAYQSSLSGQTDGYVCKFDNQGQKIWGTYYGGNLSEYDMNMQPSSNNTFFVVGHSTSTSGLTTTNSYQPNISTYDINNGTPQNIFIAYFEPVPLSTSTFNTANVTLFPNPNNGNFTISCKNDFLENSNLEIYDTLGKRLYQQKLYGNETVINLENFSKGIYVAKISKNNMVLNSKISIE
ncbi:T9SS type A sorting domain-containing protein [Flavobacterium tegetincola]|uniref:T9SS type A sorting domain-containing protein n=1 Tax=Flavobacterium tegetincola TaxID=150172 RepID=UPI000411308D|nr:T9SS type A sorting domain-containing protein [Flavobacterium tegetincola]